MDHNSTSLVVVNIKVLPTTMSNFFFFGGGGHISTETFLSHYEVIVMIPGKEVSLIEASCPDRQGLIPKPGVLMQPVSDIK